MKRITLSHRAVTVVVAVLAGLAMSATIPGAASAEPGYPQQNSSTTQLTLVDGSPTDCWATAWVGINDNGYVSGYGAISCNSTKYRLGADTQLTDHGIRMIDRDWRTCQDCSYLYTGVSGGWAASGQTFCTRVTGEVGFGIFRGNPVACVTKW